MKTYYIKLNKDNIVVDAITFPYGDYKPIQIDELPGDILGGWYKYENGKIVKTNDYITPDVDFVEAKIKAMEDKIRSEVESKITLLEEENKLLKVQKEALVERGDFHEEVLTEIIMLVNP